MESLRQTIERGLLDLEVGFRELEGILSRAVDVAAAQGLVPEDTREQLLLELLKRERKFSTAIGNAVAVPHAYLEGVPQAGIVFLRLSHPVNLGAPDGVPTRFLFVLTGPPGHAQGHLDTLTTIARLMSDDEFRYALHEARSQQDLLDALDEFERRTSPEEVAAIAEPTPGLMYTGRFAGGVIADVRRRLPHYVSDFTDAFHPKTFTTILFLYFACLAPTIAFGGLIDRLTGGWIGTTEMLLAGGLCGITFALLGGQPLIILGSTGPLVVFISVLYQSCVYFQLDENFLQVFAWTGIWTGLFTILLALTDATCLIRFFTRFTDETFAALISLIYIFEALKKIGGYVQGAGEEDLSHDEAFLSLILALGTFAVAMLISRLRRSRYLLPGVREFLADFGPTLALVLLIAFGSLFPNVHPASLNVPETLGTTAGRPWRIDLFAGPPLLPLWAIGPALLATVLIYLDENITARLVNNRDHRLRKGEGYHLDLLVVGLLIGVGSVFGLPWFVAATVRSLNHVRALATSEEVVTSGGERRDRILRVRENRLTGLAIHALILCSVLLLDLLKMVPMAVLYGLFLYMGVVSIAGNQFFERVSLWLMDPKLYPRTHYIQRVPMRVIHMFTLLQVICFAVLWIVKESRAGILFPMFIGLLVPVRLLAGRYFEQRHLEALDAEELPDEEATEWL